MSHRLREPVLPMPASPGPASALVRMPLPYPWQSETRGTARIHLAGTVVARDAILAAAAAGDLEALGGLLRREADAFGFIFENDSHVVAATDRIRGYPVYVREADGRFEVAASTCCWTAPENAGEFDETRVGRFLASGYTIGSDTLFSTVRRLVTGEAVLLGKAGGPARFHRYYLFKPEFEENGESDDVWEGRLEAALDAATDRAMARAGGAAIWVPLSAGYDSRAVLAKLLERGYDRIETFSYGVPGNAEAAVAREIAAKAGVPWRHVPSLPERPRETFAQDHVSGYFLEAGGLGTTPAMTEYFPLRFMVEAGLLREGDCIVNGQSGDYLTGAHLPKADTVAEAVRFIRNKHFGLLRGELAAFGEDAASALLDEWSRSYLHAPLDRLRTPEDVLSFYLAFEGQERQCEYVVQQQRLYDFLHLKWSLPLWDGDLMDVFEAAPLHEHRSQRLYLRYLRRWNFRGLFDEGRRPHNPWPRWKFAIQSVARLASLFGGEAGKQRAYKHLYYWSERNYLYALFGRRTHRGMIDEIRGPVSLFTLDYVRRVRRHLGLEPRRPGELLFNRLQAGA